MDLLSHALLTYKLIGKKPITVVSGLMPDLPYYLTYPTFLLVTDQLEEGLEKNEWAEPPKWMHTLHFAFHSFPVIFAVGLFIRIVTGRWPRLLMMAWALHVLIDIPTHSKKNWAPEFLWPLSKFTVEGVSVAEWQVNALKKLKVLRRRPRIPPYRQYDI